MDSSKQGQKSEEQKPGVVEAAKKKVFSPMEAHEAHKANPGPALPQDFNVAQEGSKEERRAKAHELNK